MQPINIYCSYWNCSDIELGHSIPLCLIACQINGTPKKTYCAKSFGVAANDSDAESDAKSDASAYYLDEDNRDDSEIESSSGESLVLESSNSEI